MPSVQLTRLRSQINALALHFENCNLFSNSLLTLLKLYSDKQIKNIEWYENKSSIKLLNVPDSVITELDAKLGLLAKEKPDSALENADLLWKSDQYEVKRSAISLLSNLDKPHQNDTIERIRAWINPELDKRIMADILKAFEYKSDILLDEEWVRSLSKWLASQDYEMQRLGLRALSQTVKMKYKNLPQIFNILSPVIQNPRIAIQKDLVELIKILADQSEAETASFLIMCGTLYPNADVKAFIRKSLSLFDLYFQTEIKTALN